MPSFCCNSFHLLRVNYWVIVQFTAEFSFGVPKRRQLETKGSGVATQTESGRVLSLGSMNKLRVWVRQSGTELPVSSPWRNAGLNEVWKCCGCFPASRVQKVYIVEKPKLISVIIVVKIRTLWNFCQFVALIFNKDWKPSISSRLVKTLRLKILQTLRHSSNLNCLKDLQEKSRERFLD